MLKPNFVWASATMKLLILDCGFWIHRFCSIHNPQSTIQHQTAQALMVAVAALLGGCATPEYAVRTTPVPNESSSAIEIERAISEVQAKEFQQQGARPIQANERLGGFDITSVVTRISRVTERPSLPYRPWLYQDKDPNAASLADGRIYISTGMLAYLQGRGSRTDELAFVLSHELAHTVAQHLVKRYEALQRQQLIMGLVAAGVAAATQGRGASGEQMQQLAMNAASIIADIRNSGYSQEQELEADQLGIRYIIKAGYHPTAALDLLEDFGRFEGGSPFLRTHPYSALRREYLQRYLQETTQSTSQTVQAPAHPAAFRPPSAPSMTDERPRRIGEHIRQLREIQRSYPEGSVSWKNLQRQIDALETVER